MFEDFFEKCRPADEVKPSKKRVSKNIAAVRSLIDSETEGNTMTKRKIRIKPLIIAAAAVAAMTATLFTVNAASGGNLVRFFIGGKEVEGGYRDYVDHDGYRHVMFDAVVPGSAENYAVVFDIDEPDYEKAVRVLTDESDPEFFEKLKTHHKENEQIMSEREALKAAGASEDELPEYLDLDITFKDSEYCAWEMKDEEWEPGKMHGFGGGMGGRFMNTGSAAGKPSSSMHSEHLNEDGTKTLHFELEYYVGLE